jgi:DNA-directed RNA polymerase specialized sigma24 family protein
LAPTPPVSRWLKIMFITLSTATERNGFASDAEIANLRVAIRNFVRVRVNDTTTADDLTQDVLVRAQRAVSSLSEPAKMKAWMFQIARNVVADHFKRSRRPVATFEDRSSSGGPDLALPARRAMKT